MDGDTEGTHGSLCFSVLRVMSQSRMGPWVIYVSNLVTCTEFAFKTASVPLGSSGNRAGGWDHSKFYALAKKRSKTSWPCSKQEQMGQASPLLMDQIVQGPVMAREGHYSFVMAQEAEKPLHCVGPKNCRQSPETETLIGNGGKGKARNFLPSNGERYGIKSVVLPEILPFVLYGGKYLFLCTLT